MAIGLEKLVLLMDQDGNNLFQINEMPPSLIKYLRMKLCK